MSFQYKIYGLRIVSSRRISLLTEQRNGATDLTVYWATDKTETPDAALDWREISTDELKQRNGISLWESKTGAGVFTKLRYETEISNLDFVIDDLRKNLWVIHHTDESEIDLESLFVGPVLGCILRLLGTICLHASVVNIDGKAVVIMGGSTGGKSSTAAGIFQLGHQVLADDVAAITVRDNRYFVQPGYPKIRLRPEPAATLFREKEPSSLPMVYSDRDSRYLSLESESGFCSESRPLAALYLLDKRDEALTTPFIEPIEAHEKLIKLTENTFGSYMVYKDLRIKEFKFLAELAKKMPVRRLSFGNDLRTLPLQCRAIISDFRRLTN